MTYVRSSAEISAEFHARDAVASLTFRASGTHMRFVAPGSVTRGRFGLFEWNMQPRTAGADAHFHRTFSESFFVTSGMGDYGTQSPSSFPSGSVTMANVPPVGLINVGFWTTEPPSDSARSIASARSGTCT